MPTKAAAAAPDARRAHRAALADRQPSPALRHRLGALADRLHAGEGLT